MDELPDQIQERRDENIEAARPVYTNFSWGVNLPWDVGPGVLRRIFEVNDEVTHRIRFFTAQIAGFQGNLAEMFQVCRKVTRAIEDDYGHILNKIDTGNESDSWFVLDGCVVSVSEVSQEVPWGGMLC